MNLFISQQRLSARFIAAVAIVALLLSAFPASFFVAEAVTSPSYVITGHKYECVDNGVGYDCDTPLADWAIFAQNAGTMDRVYATTSASGAYSITVPAGIWEVYEVMQDNWEQYQVIKNGDHVDDIACRFNFGEVMEDPDYSFLSPSVALAASEEADGSCDFGNKRIQMQTVTGYKLSDENNNGERDADDRGIGGWKITATDSSKNKFMSVQATTDSNGLYSLLLQADGVWKITEESRSGWTQKAVYQNGLPSYVVMEDGAPIPYIDCNFGHVMAEGSEDDILYSVDGGPSCDFLNYQTPRSGGGSGTRVKDRTPSVPTGEVLGAATSTPQCSVYLNEYMRQGNAASTTEVTKLQIFMNAVGIKLEITGAFDDATDAAVRAFQAQHKAEVLTPWYTAKIVSHENPTGWVYQLTRWKINNIVCPGSEAYPVLN